MYAQLVKLPDWLADVDAAHLMPPNGEGANLAMRDGAELGQAIAAHPHDREAAPARHERTMVTRAAAHAEDGLLETMFADGAPHSMVAMLSGVP